MSTQVAKSDGFIEPSGTAPGQPEIIIGIVNAVGCDVDRVVAALKKQLERANFLVVPIRVSSSIFPMLDRSVADAPDEYTRISRAMDLGNKLREKSPGAIAGGIAAAIISARAGCPPPQASSRGTAYVVRSLKHPKEVEALRRIYAHAFHLIGASESDTRRTQNLEAKGLSKKQIDELITRDQAEPMEFGQQFRDTYHLADLFVRVDDSEDRLKAEINRYIDLLFGTPHATPTFDEYAMFLAFASAVKSADLSCQVGAVITREQDVIATGANDVPRFGGGTYWPDFDPTQRQYADAPDGRDYRVGHDPNKRRQTQLIDDILSGVKATEPAILDSLRTQLEQSDIRALTEFGRAVHAEMDALMTCARLGLGTRRATLHCTTMPCHNCAKHIVSAGIERVVYVEPYQKSLARELFPDSISFETHLEPRSEEQSVVAFEPFFGVGPRRFYDLFSMGSGSGQPKVRKNKDGTTIRWSMDTAVLRTPVHTDSYLQLERLAAQTFALPPPLPTNYDPVAPEREGNHP